MNSSSMSVWSLNFKVQKVNGGEEDMGLLHKFTPLWFTGLLVSGLSHAENLDFGGKIQESQEFFKMKISH